MVGPLVFIVGETIGTERDPQNVPDESSNVSLALRVHRAPPRLTLTTARRLWSAL
jgi:hypothetical protein